MYNNKCYQELLKICKSITLLSPILAFLLSCSNLSLSIGFLLKLNEHNILNCSLDYNMPFMIGFNFLVCLTFMSSSLRIKCCNNLIYPSIIKIVMIPYSIIYSVLYISGLIIFFISSCKNTVLNNYFIAIIHLFLPAIVLNCFVFSYINESVSVVYQISPPLTHSESEVYHSRLSAEVGTSVNSENSVTV